MCSCMGIACHGALFIVQIHVSASAMGNGMAYHESAMEQMIEAAKGCPHLKAGGQITIYETFSVM